MTKSRLLTVLTSLSACITLCSYLLFTPSYAQQPANDVAIDNDDIGGVVTGPKGPEAGVWVIAETRDLPVRYIKSVVTDDRGRFVVPDLPAARRPRSPASTWRSRQWSRRTRRPPRTTTRRSTGTRC